jgi:hypothetical protein
VHAEGVERLGDKTPLWSEVSEAYDAKKEHVRVRDHAVDLALRALK